MRRDAWVVLGFAGAVALGWGGAAGAEERLRAGLKGFTLAGGYSFSHNKEELSRGVADVDGAHGIPHLGYVLTDERGDGWLRGNFEILAEPTVIRLTADSESATIAGVAALGRWVFASGGRIRPYLEAGLGVLGGQVELRQTNCDVNFVLQGGTGVLLFVSESMAVTAGYRFHHLSNANTCANNLGLNSSLFILGVSYFFP